MKPQPASSVPAAQTPGVSSESLVTIRASTAKPQHDPRHRQRPEGAAQTRHREERLQRAIRRAPTWG